VKKDFSPAPDCVKTLNYCFSTNGEKRARI
jgi:hypothetical protein